MKNAQLLAGIAIKERGRLVMCCTDPVELYNYPESKHPGCLICNAVRDGLIDADFAIDNRIDSEDGFSEFFGVTEQEAGDVIFHNHLKIGSHTNGENYYQACKELLEKHGYGHLLEEKVIDFQAMAEELSKQAPIPEENTMKSIQNNLEKFVRSA